MGTLFNQKERDYCDVGKGSLDRFLEDAKEIAKQRGITVADVIAAKHALELARQNDLAASDGDIKDEQLAGFGELIQQVNESLQAIASALKSED